MIDLFLAKTTNMDDQPCSDFKSVMDKVILGIKFALGIDCKLEVKSEKEVLVKFSRNPLDENVKLPDQLQGLEYSNIICGVIRGCMEAINLKVKCFFVKDRLLKNVGGGVSALGGRGSESESLYEINVQFEETIK